MEHYWRDVPFVCTSCDVPCLVKEMHASVATDEEVIPRTDCDVDFRVNALCPKCHKALQFLFTSKNLRSTLEGLDAKAESETHPKKPTELTEEDIKFLHAFHIQGEGA